MPYQLDPVVVDTMAQENITVSELVHMLDHAAITSRLGCNRRFHYWGFEVRQGKVLSMRNISYVTLGEDRGRGFMEEPHDACEGKGCLDCGGWGIVVRYL